MYIINGIAYAGDPVGEIRVTEAKALDDMILIVTFNTGEQKLYDASGLLDYPAFQPLKDEGIFKNPRIEYGVVTWNDGEIDIAPEVMYQQSYSYDRIC